MPCRVEPIAYTSDLRADGLYCRDFCPLWLYSIRDAGVGVSVVEICIEAFDDPIAVASNYLRSAPGSGYE